MDNETSATQPNRAVNGWTKLLPQTKFGTKTFNTTVGGRRGWGVGGGPLQHPDHLAAQLVKQRGHDGTSVGKSRLTRGKRRKVWNHKKKQKKQWRADGRESDFTFHRPESEKKDCVLCMYVWVSDVFVTKSLAIFF